MTFHLIHLQGVPIFEQLQLEEALLRTDTKNWCILNEASPPAIVMGISGKPQELIDQTKMDAAPLPLIKRFSGGGTVVIDQDTLFATFICEQTLHDFPPYPEHILRWSADLYKEAWGLQGFALRENDYVLDEKKCGGNAQYIRKERWLHHTTFLWSYQQKLMDYLLLPKKRPQYRQDRDHNDFVCTLKPHFPKKETLFEQLKAHLKEKYEIVEVSYQKALEQVAEAPHRKATTLL